MRFTCPDRGQTSHRTSEPLEIHFAQRPSGLPLVSRALRAQDLSIGGGYREYPAVYARIQARSRLPDVDRGYSVAVVSARLGVSSHSPITWRCCDGAPRVFGDLRAKPAKPVASIAWRKSCATIRSRRYGATKRPGPLPGGPRYWRRTGSNQIAEAQRNAEPVWLRRRTRRQVRSHAASLSRLRARRRHRTPLRCRTSIRRTPAS